MLFLIVGNTDIIVYGITDKIVYFFEKKISTTVYTSIPKLNSHVGDV